MEAVGSQTPGPVHVPHQHGPSAQGPAAALRCTQGETGQRAQAQGLREAAALSTQLIPTRSRTQATALLSWGTRGPASLLLWTVLTPREPVCASPTASSTPEPQPSLLSSGPAGPAPPHSWRLGPCLTLRPSPAWPPGQHRHTPALPSTSTQTEGPRPLTQPGSLRVLAETTSEAPGLGGPVSRGRRLGGWAVGLKTPGGLGGPGRAGHQLHPGKEGGSPSSPSAGPC